MTDAQIQAAIARGIAKRRTEHLERLTKYDNDLTAKIARATTAEQIQVIKKEIDDAFSHHYKRQEKNIEYKHYEDAGYNDDYIETLHELDSKLADREAELGL